VSVFVADSVGRLAAVRTSEDEFSDFYAAHYSPLAAYCWSLLRDRELAHDVTQESFARMVARWRRIEDPPSYLYRVATNLVRRAWRARATDRDVMDAVAAESTHFQPGPDADVMSLKAAVDALPRRLRDVVLLHYYADLPITSGLQSTRRSAEPAERTSMTCSWA